MTTYRKDPTQNWLDAALLDPQVAGKFKGQRYAFVAVMKRDGKPWGVGIAVKDEAGYNPVEGTTFEWDSMDDASAFCEGMNHHINLSRIDAACIVASTMRGSVRY